MNPNSSLERRAFAQSVDEMDFVDPVDFFRMAKRLAGFYRPQRPSLPWDRVISFDFHCRIWVRETAGFGKNQAEPARALRLAAFNKDGRDSVY